MLDVKNVVSKISLSIFALFMFIGFCFPNNAFSWNDDVTHKLLADYAAKSSILDEFHGDYLRNTLGFNNGLNHELTLNADRDETIEWIKLGAESEDAGNILNIVFGKARFDNHFHNPLKQWSEAGLTDLKTGKSSLLWAQDGAYQQTFEGEDQSWGKIRDYYHLALTSATDAERQENFARTFKGLGHQMHLIQDAAQPDHVRNDAHPEDSLVKRNEFGRLYFETWAKRKFTSLEELQAFVPNPAFPAISLETRLTNNSDAPVYITQFIDTDQYDGSNPSTSRAQGIAEYTNANFVSDHTIFTSEKSVNDKHYFPYPRKSSTNVQQYIDQNLLPETIIAEDDVVEKSFYISKIGDGEIINHFVRPGYLSKKIYDITRGGELYYKTFFRDEKCHQEYAAHLLPRAIGYSAALLNYFFRGNIDLIPVKGDVNKFVFANYTNEEMDGTFEIYYDNESDERTQLWMGNFLLGAGETSDVITDFSTLPVHDDIKDPGQYILVFRGRMGNENDAVVGRVVNLRRIEITPPDQRVYSIVDGSKIDHDVFVVDAYGNDQVIRQQKFDNLKLKLRYLNHVEDIHGGTLTLVAEYKKRTDYMPDMSEDPVTSDERELYVSYSMANPVVLLTGQDLKLATEFIFDFPSGQEIPAGITDLVIRIYFQGFIGDEQEAVTLEALKDLSEPTHYLFWNLTDMYVLYGNIYTSEKIKTTPELAQFVDKGEDDGGTKGVFNEIEIGEPYIEPYNVDMEITFADEQDKLEDGKYTVSVKDILPGRHFRFIALFDWEEANYLRLKWRRYIPDDVNDKHADFITGGTVSQDYEGQFYTEEVPPFRTINAHRNLGVLSCMRSTGEHDLYCPYPENGEGTIPLEDINPVEIDTIKFPAWP